MTRCCSLVVLAGCAGLTSAAFGQWVNFQNETATRLIASPSVGSNDPEEKDYAWGDFDQDGDIDLVVVRKSPATSIGRRRNVLLMNEGIAEGHSINGVLVDRTAEYASAANDGGQGMLDMTDDRDVVAADINGDGWLDLVTATTYGQGLTKTISHPRVYLNQGESNGVWQGFFYDEPRFPNLGAAPNFCAVGIGDVSGDKAPDLYFVDYDNISATPYEDKLLINNGSGSFTDQSNSRMTSAMLASGFGSAAWIADMNGDGWLDVIKSENGPAKISYNGGSGFFNQFHTAFSSATYFVSVGDLNNDGRLDLVTSNDGTDVYKLNTSPPGSTGLATFNPTNFTFPGSGGFGSSSRYGDLNNDGYLDVMIADVDVDVPPPTCNSWKMYRNLGNAPNVTMSNQGTGGITPVNCAFDNAVFDINGDGWLDIVLGRASTTMGTAVWMNQPPSGLVFNYPQGLPGFIDANETHAFEVNVAGVGSAVPQANSAVLHYSVNGGAFTSVPMTAIQGNLYSATLPAVPCADLINFYVSATSTTGTPFTDPSNAPAETYNVFAASGTQITLEERFEGDTSSWTVVNFGLTAGAWQVADPNGTVNAGAIAAPDEDAGANEDVKCFVTENGPVGGPANANDVDGGPTRLLSPTFDLAGTDAIISYQRWMYCEDQGTPDGDFLITEVSNDGGITWTLVHQTGGTGSTWQAVDFRIGEFVDPTSQMRVRFSVADNPNNSVTEAGIDNFLIEELVCGAICPADVAGNDGQVDVSDLLAVINAWGPCSGCAADIDDSGVVDVSDLLAVINGWGPCP